MGQPHNQLLDVPLGGTKAAKVMMKGLIEWGKINADVEFGRFLIPMKNYYNCKY